MTGFDAVVRLIDILDARAVEYMLVGSLASNLYGILRSTNDADFVLALPAASLGPIVKELGKGYRLDPQISFEAITGTIRRVVYSPPGNLTLETFQLSDDSFDQERFARRVRIRVEAFDRTVSVPTAEDIINKLQWSRPKDFEDAFGVLAVQRDRLDWTYLEKWTTAHGTRERLEELKARA